MGAGGQDGSQRRSQGPVTLPPMSNEAMRKNLQRDVKRLTKRVEELATKAKTSRGLTKAEEAEQKTSKAWLKSAKKNLAIVAAEAAS